VNSFTSISRDGKTPAWDHTTHPDFYEYYAKESESEATVRRFKGVQGAVLRVAAANRMSETLDVADIGCGAGTQSRLWAERGHRVYGLDINEPLIELARSRVEQTGLKVEFEIGTATSLPWSDASMDVCLLPELLEHVVEWEACLYEAARVLRPGGLLYVSTTNVLCPKQQEFDLPLYSWYPAPAKRYCEQLAVTTSPEIANYAKYPAVNWFSFYRLKTFLKPLGFACLDRFDVMDAASKGKLVRLGRQLVLRSRLMRLLGHVFTSGTSLVGVKSHVLNGQPCKTERAIA
jgi:2-polyprenyl-6-hydroxyphenyl methylase/3-demethylubiquinone-9 3-methyltransferase